MPSRRDLTLSALLILVTLATYATSLGNQYIWDDDDYVTKNKTLRNVQGLIQIWFDPSATPQYYPLVFSTFWIEYQLWGLSPAGYHFVNIALHAANAYLLWVLLRRLSIPGAWFCAAIFAVHPVHVESVAWITERKNVLSGLFYLSSFYWLLIMRDRQAAQASSTKVAVSYTTAMALYIAALLSKTVTCTLPAAFLVVQWYQTGSIKLHLARLMAPFFIVGIAMGLNTARLESSHVGARGPEFDWSLTERIQIASGAINHYAQTLLYPANLIFFYPKWELDSSKPMNWSSTILVLVAFGVALLTQKRWGRGPLAALLFFAGTLFPALGFINVYPMRYSFVADHFQYLASMGMITLVGSLLWQSTKRQGTAPAITMVVTIMLLLGGLAAQQSRIYYDAESLWKATLERNPDSAIANCHLGSLLMEQDQVTAALEYFRRSLAAQPLHNPEPLYNTLICQGHLCLLEQRYEEAETLFRQALQMDLPRTSAAESELGNVRLMQNRVGEAIGWFELASRRTPDKPKYRLQLALAYAAAGERSLALDHARVALSLQPDWAVAQQWVSQLEGDSR